MAINGFDPQAMARQRLPEQILLPSPPLPLEPKKNILRDHELKDQIPGKDSPDTIAKADVQRIRERFEPLEPVLHKALDGNRTLRREFQALEKLTQPAPAVPPLPIVDRGREPVLDSEPSLALNASDRRIHPSGVDLIGSGNIKPFVGEPATGRRTPSVVAPDVHAKEFRAKTDKFIALENDPQSPPVPNASSSDRGHQRSRIAPLVSVGLDGGDRVLAKADLNAPLDHSIPQENRSGNPLKISETVQDKKIDISGEVVKNHPMEPDRRPSHRPVPEPVAHRAPGAPLPPKPPQLFLGNRDMNVGPRPRADNEPHPALRPAVVDESSRLTRAVSPKSSVALSDATVPAPKILSFQPAITTNDSLTTSTAVTSQSATLTGRPVVVSTDETETPPEVIRDRFLRSFNRRLKENEVNDIVESARRLARLLEVHPLTNAVFATREGNVTVPTGSQGTLVGSAIIQTTGIVENGPTLGVETVALRPLDGDNGGHSRPVSVPNDKAKDSEDQERSRIRSQVIANQGPPLLNIDQPRRPLPTNLHSRVVAVPTVNLMDFVL